MGVGLYGVSHVSQGMPAALFKGCVGGNILQRAWLVGQTGGCIVFLGQGPTDKYTGSTFTFWKVASESQRKHKLSFFVFLVYFQE